jgi:nitrogen fixation-related uncharacterized protein
MNTIQIIVIACILGAIGLITLWWGAKTAHDLDQEDEYIAPPRFQPRKVSYTKGVDPYEIEKPKRKKKRYYNKKKKPAVAENAQVEKRPVGRPRKSE